MQYRKLGKSGLQVSALSLGSWLTFGQQIDDETAEALMKTAYDAGVNFFDNAEGYARGKAETVMGNILKKMGWDRSSYVVSSKVFFGDGGTLPNQTGLSRKHIFEGCHASLKRMQLDYLDLYFCHRPDKNTPIEETVWAMNQLIQQGKILYWGTSQWSSQEITEAYLVARENKLIGPLMEQPHYNMLTRYRVEVEYQQLYSNFGLGMTIWSPLASGVLTDKYLDAFPQDTRMSLQGMEWLKNRNLNADYLEKARALHELARGLDTSLAKLAVAWCLKNPNVSTVILGASKPRQLEETLGSFDILEKLNEAVLQQIEGILQNKPKAPAF